jgi:hypothetical protein
MASFIKTVAAAALTPLLLAPRCSHAALIAPGDVIVIPGSFTVPSGNGGLNLRMFTNAGGGNAIENDDVSAPAFDGDDGNGNAATNNTSTFDEYYYTTIGDVRSFYNKYFPNGSGGSIVTEIVLMLDISESSNDAPNNNGLAKLDIILNPTVGTLDPTGDISRAEQEAISSYTGGALASSLQIPLTLNDGSGQGVADYAIFTNINPFDITYSASDRLLFNVEMTGLSNGSEEIFLSNVIGASGNVLIDPQAVPETSPFVYGGLIAAGLCAWKSRQKRRQEQVLI